MGRTCMQKCIDIMRKIEQNDKSNVISYNDLVRYIKIIAGMNKLTVDSYLKHLKDLNFITAGDKLGQFKLNFDEVKKYEV